MAPLAPLVLAAALLACPKEKAAVKKTEPTPSATPSEATPSEREREPEEMCVDRWLSERKLDRYGSPQGTMYAGGTPLFNERTGESVDRLEHVYKKHPEARAACAPAPGTRRGRDAAP